MLVLRVLIGLGLAYLVLLLLAWRFQDRLAFPAPRAGLPHPKRGGGGNGGRGGLGAGGGTKLVGWDLAPKKPETSPTSPAFPRLLRVFRHRETVATILPLVR